MPVLIIFHVLLYTLKQARLFDLLCSPELIPSFFIKSFFELFYKLSDIVWSKNINIFFAIKFFGFNLIMCLLIVTIMSFNWYFLYYHGKQIKLICSCYLFPTVQYANCFIVVTFIILYFLYEL